MAKTFLVLDALGERKSYQIVGLGGRFYAFFIDLQIRFLFTIGVFIAYSSYQGIAFANPFSDLIFPSVLSVESIMNILIALFLTFITSIKNIVIDNMFLLGVFFLYHPVLEVILRGKTPGKVIAGISIVNHHGKRAGFLSMIVRNLLRFFDVFPGNYLLGAFAIFSSEYKVRLGDMMAGTVLIYNNRTKAAPLEEGKTVGSKPLSDRDRVFLIDLLTNWNKTNFERRIQISIEFLKKMDKIIPAGVADKQLERRLLVQLKAIAQQNGATF